MERITGARPSCYLMGRAWAGVRHQRILDCGAQVRADTIAFRGSVGGNRSAKNGPLVMFQLSRAWLLSLVRRHISADQGESKRWIPTRRRRGAKPVPG
ncbi:hypothetical protein RHCRD62_10083 [Rhodococcus sp. RD6.2]|nr:hypothetical protein RHCRD62_10083 [Rhodococcus sp. RD6.2]